MGELSNNKTVRGALIITLNICLHQEAKWSVNETMCACITCKKQTEADTRR